MLNPKDYQSYFEKGIDYQTYWNRFEDDLATNQTSYAKYLPMNWQRMQRVTKTATISDDLLKALHSLPTKIYAIVITEHWCGDASQSVAFFDLMQKNSNGLLEIRYLYRDENLPLMDAHLTNNGRAIPTFLVFDENFHLLAEWGPRPKEAQELVVKLKSNPETASDYFNEVHKWYAKDKQQSLNQEFTRIFTNLFA